MRRLALVALAALVACELRPPGSGGDAHRSQSAPTRTAAPSSPRLVLLVVLDQFPDWALDRHLALLPGDGFLRRALATGRRYRAEYPYAFTLTAPGHATMVTGVLPAEHGVHTNGVWSAARKASISIFDDGEHALIGGSAPVATFAGPRVIRATTVADALRATWGDRAHVVSLSLKDRGAIPAGGAHPDAVVWYDPKARGFVTSRYYGAVPGWVTAFEAAHPIAALIAPWTVPDPDALAAALGRDDAPGESTQDGFTPSFPHDPSGAPDPWDAIRDTPQLGEYVLELAGAAADELRLGADDVPDLLAVSVSTTDSVSHLWGPGSWEYVDALRRVDRALARLVDHLGPRGVAVVITSDHGVAPLVEAGPAGGGRVLVDAVVETIEAALDRERGPRDWIARWSAPYVYLGVDGEAQRDAIVPAIVRRAAAAPGVGIAVDVATARTWAGDPDPVRRRIAASLPADVDGDVVIVPREHWIYDPKEPVGTGANHGTPWDEDRLVPLILVGPGVAAAPGAPRETVDARRIAPTLAALLGVPEAARPGPGQRSLLP